MKRSPLTDPMTVPSGHPSRFMQRHPLVCLCCYFLMAFVMTWLYLLLFASLSIPAALPGFDLIFGTVALLLILATRGHLGYPRPLRGTTLPASERGAAQASVTAGKAE